MTNYRKKLNTIFRYINIIKLSTLNLPGLVMNLNNSKILYRREGEKFLRNSYILFTSFGQYFYVPVILFRCIDHSISMYLLIYSDIMSEYIPRDVLRHYVTVNLLRYYTHHQLITTTPLHTR